MTSIKTCLSLAAACTIAFTAPAAAKGVTILYVPLDNRPVNTTYVQNTMAAAGCNVIMPPEKMIASNIVNGKPDALMNWLFTKAPKADAAVISTDSLIYGGLVASRTHNIPLATLKKRATALIDLERALPIKLYAFSTIMRTPRASKGRVEPPYYADYGPHIFAYSEFVDKGDQHHFHHGGQRNADIFAIHAAGGRQVIHVNLHIFRQHGTRIKISFE